MKLSRSVNHDYLGWHYNRTGIFSVKSAYWLATHLPDFHHPDPPRGRLDLKQLIWTLNTATKIKHFLWKMVSNILPTGSTLAARRIMHHPQCVSCCLPGETSNHIFFTCSYAQAVWKATPFPAQNLFLDGIDFESKIAMVLDFLKLDLGSKLTHLPLWILWRLWKHRNTLLFQRRNIPWEKTIQLAKKDAAEWHGPVDTSVHLPPRQQKTAQRNDVRWRKPPAGWIKCNYDASWSGGTNTLTKVGWILRVSLGAFIAAGQGQVAAPNNALESEACALLMAMQFCWSRSFRYIIFEGDSRNLLDLLNNKALHFGMHNWLCDVYAWRKRFDHIAFTWTSRSTNVPADILAKLAIPNNAPYYAHNVLPDILWSSVMSDSI